jgi:hypothetical protein
MNMKMRMLALFIGLSLLIGLFLTANANASSLALSVTTDKPSYRLQTATPLTINIGGNLTSNGTPVSGGLVAVTVFQGKIGAYVRPVLFRTLATGSSPSQSWPLNVSVGVGILGDAEFVPHTVFTSPSSQLAPPPSFNVTFQNTGSSPLLELYLTLTVFDAAKVPITTVNYTINQPIPVGQTTSIFLSTALQSWVALGNATVYVSAFNTISHYDYFPYCPEASAQFTIVSASGSQTSSQENPNTSTEQVSSLIKGNYNLAFNLSYAQDPYVSSPLNSPWGNYTVEVAGVYKGQEAIDSYTFWVKIPGEVIGDGVVNIKDVFPVATYWLQTVPPAPAWVDISGTGVININDVFPIAQTWLDLEEPLP